MEWLMRFFKSALFPLLVIVFLVYLATHLIGAR
jgi:hypothetical protein